jgi:hypothetical protein
MIGQATDVQVQAACKDAASLTAGTDAIAMARIARSTCLVEYPHILARRLIMSKIFALAIAVAALAAFVSQASAGRHRGGCCAPSCCETAASCCGDTAAAPTPAADNNANAANNTAQAPQSTRSFSYQPSTNNVYSVAPGRTNGGRIMNSYGLRGAGSKEIGNY